MLVALGACGEPAARDLKITAPVGLGEIVPVASGTLDVTWTGSFDLATLDVALAPRAGGASVSIVKAGRSASGEVTATGFTWTGLDVGGVRAPSGYYDIVTDVGGGPVDAGDTHVVVVQGLVFTQPAPGGAALAVPGDIDFTTSTISTLDVKLFADQTMIKDVSVPGELHEIARTITWDGAPLAKGTYTLSAQVTDAAAGASYTVPGGTASVP